MDNIFELHADICKTFASAKRLEIIYALRNGQMSACQLLEQMSISKANLSQHLRVLVEKGVVVSHRVGVNMYYRLSDIRITQACELMREVMIARLDRNKEILASSKR